MFVWRLLSSMQSHVRGNGLLFLFCVCPEEKQRLLEDIEIELRTRNKIKIKESTCRHWGERLSKLGVPVEKKEHENRKCSKEIHKQKLFISTIILQKWSHWKNWARRFVWKIGFSLRYLLHTNLDKMTMASTRESFKSDTGVIERRKMLIFSVRLERDWTFYYSYYRLSLFNP